jgi:hypothetical protein
MTAHNNRGLKQQQDHQHNTVETAAGMLAKVVKLATAGTPLELGCYRSNIYYRNILMSTTAELDSKSKEACNIQQGRQQQQQRQAPYRKVLVLVLPNH